MNKIQQFKVMAFTYERLANSNFDINITSFEAERNDELVALADSEVLRAIRRITSHSFSQAMLDDLYIKRKNLTKQNNSMENKREIITINNKIREMLFIPEYISVITKKKRNYPKIGKLGFCINGTKYVRLLCGAAHARTNRTIFCAEYIFDKLNNILRCGCDDIEIVPAKWNAYYALMSSSTFRVSSPRVCIVPDKEIKMTKTVDWVTETEPQDIINREDKELTFNLWDGMGLISPDFATKWSEELGLEYIPSGFLIRAPFIKGMVATFDFHKFATEISKNSMVTDLYGNIIDTSYIDIILTQSQFKLWNAYKNWDDYDVKRIKNGLSWGISRTTPDPKYEKSFTRSNYQFIQVLNMNDDDIKELCAPTINWIKNVSQDGYEQMILYLLGKISKYNEPKKIWNSVQDSFIKSLMLESELINDEYIHSRIIKSLNKRIKETYIGKILLNANFQKMFNDPYAFCEYIFGMEIKGLLSEYEHYSNYWINKGVYEVVAMRSPLTWRSEVNKLSFKVNDKIKEWFKYLNSGIIYNIWGYDHMLHAGSDLDGDEVCTVNNPVYLRSRYGGCPVAYEPKKAGKCKVKYKDLYKVDMLGFNSNIGYITNCSTTLYEMQSKYNKNNKEFNEIENRLKLCCKFQSHEIDHAKGIITKKIPQYFVSRIGEKNKFGFNKEEIDFQNSIVINKRPYFMRYLYPKYNKEYKSFNEDYDRYLRFKWQCDRDNIPEEVLISKEYKNFVEYMDKRNPLLETMGEMNRLCYYMETNLKEVKKKNKKCDNKQIISIISSKNITVDDYKLSLMRDMYNNYNDFKKEKMLTLSEYATYEQFYKNIRQKSLENISSNIQELANLAIFVCYCENASKSKDFVWNVFGEGIVLNLLETHKIAHIPLLDDLGDIDYLSEKYSLFDLDLEKYSNNDIGDEELDVVADIFEEIEEL